MDATAGSNHLRRRREKAGASANVASVADRGRGCQGFVLTFVLSNDWVAIAFGVLDILLGQTLTTVVWAPYGDPTDPRG